MLEDRQQGGKTAGRKEGNSIVNQRSESVYLRNLGLVLVSGVVVVEEEDEVVVEKEEDEEEEEEAATAS